MEQAVRGPGTAHQYLFNILKSGNQATQGDWVCEISAPGAPRSIFPLQSLDGGWITDRERQKSPGRIKHTAQLL